MALHKIKLNNNELTFETSSDDGKSAFSTRPTNGVSSVDSPMKKAPPKRKIEEATKKSRRKKKNFSVAF